MKKTQEKEPTFEEAMADLEQIVDRLESGVETLDESIRLFEKGAALSVLLEQRLTQAEQKITALTAPAPETSSEAEDA